MKKLIVAVQNMEFNLIDNLDYSFEVIEYADGASEYFIIHHVELQNFNDRIEVLFGVNDFVKELRNAKFNGDISRNEFIEHINSLNELEERFNYHDTLGIRVGGGAIYWLWRRSRMLNIIL